jgi:hypothetical protein
MPKIPKRSELKKVFEYLYNLPREDKFWRNEILFTRCVFLKNAGEINYTLQIITEKVNIEERIEWYKLQNKSTDPEILFTKFFKEKEVQQLKKTKEFKELFKK